MKKTLTIGWCIWFIVFLLWHLLHGGISQYCLMVVPHS